MHVCTNLKDTCLSLLFADTALNGECDKDLSPHTRPSRFLACNVEELGKGSGDDAAIVLQ